MADLTDGMSAVVFDFFGTLTPVSPGEVWAANAARLAAVFGVSAENLLRVLDESFPERISGALGGMRQTMRAIADRLGVPVTDEQLDEASATRRTVQESMFSLRPEALGVIRTLRERGLRIGLVSDCTSELPDAWPRLPLAPLVDAPVFSCVERTRKPDPRLFLAVADRLSADPAACVYVGDGGGRELTGASAVGMHAVLLAGPDWHEHRDHRTEADWAGPRISSLLELLT
ncbi:MAG TPA: HAD family hydrolase [Streptosporangiaceae bacterium]|nr:HAD family hydrolase [Streptosporangiaceae bacterium]